LLELSDTFVDLFGRLVNLSESKLMILLRFFVFKLKVSTFAVLFILLVLLPILDTFLEPFFHEAGVALHLADARSPHVKKSFLSRLFLTSVSSFGLLILPPSFIVELLQVSFHDDFLLGLVEDLEPLMKKGGCLGLILFLRGRDFHCWSVVTDFSSYKC
jgi:hypothetical protein